MTEHPRIYTEKGWRAATGSAVRRDEDVRFSMVVLSVTWEVDAVRKDDRLSVDVEIAARGRLIVESRIHHVSGCLNV